MTYKSLEQDRWLWQLHQARHTAESDLAHSILNLFENQLDPELRQWLVEIKKFRQEDAAKCDEEIEKLTQKMIKEFNHTRGKGG